MKAAKLLLTMLAFLSLVLVTSCNNDDDDEPSVDPLVGFYDLNSATLNEEITLTLSGTTLPAGTSVTEIVRASLNADSPCADPANSLIELRANGEVHYDCVGEDFESTESQGTWVTNADRSRLSLTLIIQDNPFALNLVNLEETPTAVIGDAETFPLAELTEDGDVVLNIANVKINFERQDN